MAGQSTLEASAQDTNDFYRRTLHVLSDAAVPFLVGGSHAFLEYTGIVRNTKDFDLFLRRSDVERAMEALRGAGYRTELTFPHWLAKAWRDDDFVDLVFSSGNGMCVVDDGWFEHAVETQVLGMPVKIVPCEELLWQKCFVMERERFDGADVMHILRARAPMLRLAAAERALRLILAAAIRVPGAVHVRVPGRNSPRAFGRTRRLRAATRCAAIVCGDCNGSRVSGHAGESRAVRDGHRPVRLRRRAAGTARRHVTRGRDLLDLGHRQRGVAAPRAIARRSATPASALRAAT